MIMKCVLELDMIVNTLKRKAVIGSRLMVAVLVVAPLN
jgi:hypothetical protein